MIANINIREVLKTLEGLEQNKIYFLVLDEWDYLDQVAIQDAFARAKSDLQWTSPTILFINKAVNKLTAEEIEDLIVKYKESK